MPDRRRVPIPFGQGLDRETGSMVVRPTSAEDLRNVYFRRGKLVVRRGLEPRLVFEDTEGNPCTHVLAGQSLSSERSGVVVAYEQDNTGEVNVYQIDSEATVGELIGTWFTQAVGAEPPIVITAESYGRVFFAHDELREPQREQTVVYDPRKGNSLQPLVADLRAEGDEPVRFRGVTRHLSYIFGYGFGHEGEDRPEFVRSSLPGEPQTFAPEHYWMVGDRRDPVMGIYRAGTSALVFKEAETHEIFGSGRDDFGQRPLDTLHGILAPRLAVTVGDAVYGWSSEGPRRWQSGVEGSEDLAIPLDLEGFEPGDLVARGDLREGFAHYIPTERVVIFVFGQRVYALSIRRPQRPEWAYFELGITPHCAFTLRSHGPGTGAVTQAPPTGHPEFLDNISPRDKDELRPKWKNVGQDGDERVNIWTRELDNLAQDWTLAAEGATAGVAEGWSETDDANLTTAFSIEDEAQKIEVTAASGAGFSFIERQDITTDPIVAGEDYGISVALEVENMVGTAVGRLVYRWFDAADAQIGSDHVVDDAVAPAEFQRSIDVEPTAPAGAVRLDVLVGFRAEASGDTGAVKFRDVSVDPVAERGAWEEYGSFLVATTEEQDQRLDGFEAGGFHEVALRYRRSVFVTAGYEGDDPSTWPLESRGLASSGFVDIDAPEIEEHWYTVVRYAVSGNIRVAADFDVAITQDTLDALQEAEDAGFSWEFQLHRKVPNYDDGQGFTATETEFRVVETFGSGGLGQSLDDFSSDHGTPVGIRMVDRTEDYRDHFHEADPFEYFVRLEVSSNLGTVAADSETVERWPGRYDAPFDFRQETPSSFPPAQFDADLGEGTVDIGLLGHFPDDFETEVHQGALNEEFHHITSLVPLGPPDANSQGFNPYVRVQWRNTTDGTAWADLGAAPNYGRVDMDVSFGGLGEGTFIVYIEGLQSGDTYEFRVKTHVELSLDDQVRDRRFESPWSEVFEYTAP